MIVTLTPNPVLDRTLTVPHIEFDGMLRATSTRLDWGGKGFNVSRALKALGTDSIAMAFAGGGTGQMLEQGLHSLGIATDFVASAGETRTNVIIVDQATGRHIKVNEAGPSISPQEHDELLRRIDQRVQPGDLWVLAGSLPPGLPVNFYAEMIDLLPVSYTHLACCRCLPAQMRRKLPLRWDSARCGRRFHGREKPCSERDTWHRSLSQATNSRWSGRLAAGRLPPSRLEEPPGHVPACDVLRSPVDSQYSHRGLVRASFPS